MDEDVESGMGRKEEMMWRRKMMPSPTSAITCGCNTTTGHNTTTTIN